MSNASPLPDKTAHISSVEVAITLSVCGTSSASSVRTVVTVHLAVLPTPSLPNDPLLRLHLCHSLALNLSVLTRNRKKDWACQGAAKTPQPDWALLEETPTPMAVEMQGEEEEEEEEEKVGGVYRGSLGWSLSWRDTKPASGTSAAPSLDLWQPLHLVTPLSRSLPTYTPSPSSLVP